LWIHYGLNRLPGNAPLLSAALIRKSILKKKILVLKELPGCPKKTPASLGYQFWNKTATGVVDRSIGRSVTVDIDIDPVAASILIHENTVDFNGRYDP